MEGDPRLAKARVHHGHGGNSWTKYKAPPSMLAQEEGIMKITPGPLYKEHLILRELKALLDKEEDDLKKEQYIKRIIDIEQETLDRSIDRDFRFLFMKWLQGTSEKNVEFITEKKSSTGLPGGALVDVTRPCTSWGNKPLTRLPGVSEFLASPLDRRSEVMTYLAKLRMNLPRNVDEAYIYFKYIVMGLAIDGDACKECEEFMIYLSPNPDGYDELGNPLMNTIDINGLDSGPGASMAYDQQPREIPAPYEETMRSLARLSIKQSIQAGTPAPLIAKYMLRSELLNPNMYLNNGSVQSNNEEIELMNMLLEVMPEFVDEDGTKLTGGALEEARQKNIEETQKKLDKERKEIMEKRRKHIKAAADSKKIFDHRRRPGRNGGNISNELDKIQKAIEDNDLGDNAMYESLKDRGLVGTANFIRQKEIDLEIDGGIDNIEERLEGYEHQVREYLNDGTVEDTGLTDIVASDLKYNIIMARLAREENIEIVKKYGNFMASISNRHKYADALMTLSEFREDANLSTTGAINNRYTNLKSMFENGTHEKDADFLSILNEHHKDVMKIKAEHADPETYQSTVIEKIQVERELIQVIEDRQGNYPIVTGDIAELSQRNEQLENILDEMQAQTISDRSHIDKLVIQLKQAETKINTIEQTFIDEAKKNEKLEDDIFSANAALESTKKELEKETSKADHYLKEYSRKAIALEDTQKELETLKEIQTSGDNTELKAQIKELEEKCEQAQKETDGVADLLNNLKQSADEIERLKKEMEDVATSHAAKIEELKAHYVGIINRQSNDSQSLEGTLQALEKQKKENNRLTNANKALRTNNKNSEERFIKLKTGINAMQLPKTQISVTQEWANKVTELNAMEEEKLTLAGEKASLKSEIKILKQQLETAIATAAGATGIAHTPRQKKRRSSIAGQKTSSTPRKKVPNATPGTARKKPDDNLKPTSKTVAKNLEPAASKRKSNVPDKL